MPAPPPEILSLVDTSPEPMVLLGRDYRILAANAAYRASRAEGTPIDGHPCYRVSHHYDLPCDHAGESCPMAESLRTGQRARTVHLHHTREGELYEKIETWPVRDASGEVAYLFERLQPLAVATRVVAAEELVGRSPAFGRLLELISRVAPTDTTVQLEGESGTGKELVARAIHAGSPRAKRPFAVVDCTGMPETLFESELFGHERGAFTGATTRAPGLVAAADGGTLFLDEVGDIPLALQVKLLRFIETGTYRPLGSTEMLQADVRFVSATNRRLERLVADGRFRQDLYYRLAAFPIPLPSLRERREDIPLLVSVLLKRVARHRTLAITPAALARLAAHDFPGNIRELRNVLERASLMCDDEVIEAEHLPATIGVPGHVAPAVPVGADGEAGTRREMARRLGVSERTLYRRIAKSRASAG